MPPSRQLYEERDYHLMLLPDEALKQQYLKYTQIYLSPDTQARTPPHPIRMGATSRGALTATWPLMLTYPPSSSLCADLEPG